MTFCRWCSPFDEYNLSGIVLFVVCSYRNGDGRRIFDRQTQISNISSAVRLSITIFIMALIGFLITIVVKEITYFWLRVHISHTRISFMVPLSIFADDLPQS